MKKWEAAWLAGMIDGEGSVGLYDYGREGRRVQIQMANSEKKLVDRFREVIGCGSTVFRTNIHKSHKGRKPSYWVLKQLIPFLIAKKDKASVIINELEEKPFGRWASATKEARLAQSERMKIIWRYRKEHS